MIALDMGGRVRWSIDFPKIRADPAPSFPGITTRIEGKSLVVAVSNGLTTDVFLIGDGGSLLASTSIQGRYLIAQGEAAGKVTTELYGVSGEPGDPLTSRRIKLNEQLAQVSSVTGQVDSGFTARAVWRLDDDDLVGFGTIRDARTGYRAGIASLPRDLSLMDLRPLIAGSNNTGEAILAVCASHQPRELVAATPYVIPGARGAALHFVNFN